jgi:hypothetical protein
MSTELVESTFFAVAFYGGESRGLCCQITKDDKYIQLTSQEMKELVIAWMEYKLEAFSKS